MEHLRVLLVDDHEVVRLGLITLLEDLPWLKVVAEAGTASEALRAMRKHQPDVVVLDIRLPGESGIETCRQITEGWPQTRVIMLTSFADDELIFRALQAGASGYVLKQVGNQTLINALEAVRKGEALLDSIVTQRVIARVREGASERDAAVFQALSDREVDVLALVARGKSNADVAATLSLSEKTVRNHVSAILSKLGLSNRVEVVAFAGNHHIEKYRRNRYP
jgi:two-component system, NarL family, response regulator DevR